MKNLVVFALMAMMLSACSQLQKEELQLVEQEMLTVEKQVSDYLGKLGHPKYVWSAVNKHIHNKEAKELFLTTVTYDKGLYITDMDLSTLDDVLLSSDEILAFLKDLLGAKLVVAKSNSGCGGVGPKSSFGCTSSWYNDCLCICSSLGSPDYPLGPCLGTGTCFDWLWIC